MFITLSGRAPNNDFEYRDACAEAIVKTFQKKGIPAWSTDFSEPVYRVAKQAAAVFETHGLAHNRDDVLLLQSILTTEWLNARFGNNAVEKMFSYTVKPIVEHFEENTALWAIVVVGAPSTVKLKGMKISVTLVAEEYADVVVPDKREEPDGVAALVYEQVRKKLGSL